MVGGMRYRATQLPSCQQCRCIQGFGRCRARSGRFCRRAVCDVKEEGAIRWRLGMHLAGLKKQIKFESYFKRGEKQLRRRKDNCNHGKSGGVLTIKKLSVALSSNANPVWSLFGPPRSPFEAKERVWVQTAGSRGRKRARKQAAAEA